MSNTRSFISMQGNQLSFWRPSFFIALAIGILFIIIMIIFRRKLHKWFEKKSNQSFLFFPNIQTFLQLIGFLLLIYTGLRIYWNYQQNWVLMWESIPLHICRIHLILIALILVSKKLELMRYIVYMSFVGAFTGLLLGKMDISQKVLNDPNSVYYQNNVLFLDPGIDSLAFWDFVFAHLTILALPVLIYLMVGKAISPRDYLIILLGYSMMGLAMWIIDYGLSHIPNRTWQANYWYLGPNDVNDYKDSVGWLSMWPQNIVFVPILGLLVITIIHVLVLWNFGKSPEKVKQLFVHIRFITTK